MFGRHQANESCQFRGQSVAESGHFARVSGTGFVPDACGIARINLDGVGIFLALGLHGGLTNRRSRVTFSSVEFSSLYCLASKTRGSLGKDRQIFQLSVGATVSFQKNSVRSTLVNGLVKFSR